MRKYGNMFRAGDAPNAAQVNRVRTVDLRLTSGTTAVHSDMIMWHPEEAVESAALQLLNVLFSVPQVSVRFGRVPTSHREMVAFYIGYWRTHRDVLLDGDLVRRSTRRPITLSSSPTTARARSSESSPIRWFRSSPRAASTRFTSSTPRAQSGLPWKSDHRSVRYEYTVVDCRGREQSRGERTLDPGLHRFDVPPSGLLRLEPLE